MSTLEKTIDLLNALPENQVEVINENNWHFQLFTAGYAVTFTHLPVANIK